jgi:hypothetical protein
MKQRADMAKTRFIIRQVLISGGLSSLLGIFSVYHRHPAFDLHFLVRGFAVLVFQIGVWYLLSLWMWSRIPQILARKRKQTASRT